jgi:hypothetical protein
MESVERQFPQEIAALCDDGDVDKSIENALGCAACTAFPF